jgi:hypothetical protein
VKGDDLMKYVYLLQSVTYPSQRYIGITSNLEALIYLFPLRENSPAILDSMIYRASMLVLALLVGFSLTGCIGELSEESREAAHRKSLDNCIKNKLGSVESCGYWLAQGTGR